LAAEFLVEARVPPIERAFAPLIDIDPARPLHVRESLGLQDSGDWILAVDDTTVMSTSEIREALQRGGPKKTVRIRRGEKTLESVLDHGAEPSGADRVALAAPPT
jgi:uroporphyrinogen-III synthase